MKNVNKSIEDFICNFDKENVYVVWGCTEFAETLITTLGDSIDIRFVVDRNEKLEGTYFCGKQVKSINCLIDMSSKYKVIISNHYTVTRRAIEKQLDEWGYKKNKDYSYYEFFIAIWNWKYKQKLVASYITINITNFCSLRCKKCAAYVPYIENPSHRDLELIKRDIDGLFSVFDGVARFQIVGGEPMVYPQLDELLGYLGLKYAHKIDKLDVVTNGTIFPKENILKIMNMYGFSFSISDYSVSGVKNTSSSHYEEFMKICNRWNVSADINSSLRWIDLGAPVKQNLSMDALKIRYEDCKLDRRGLADGMIFGCCNQLHAYAGGVYKTIKNGDCLSIDELFSVSKELAFEKWYRFDVLCEHGESGYLSFCDYCNGEGALNKNYVPVAEQC